VAAHSQQLGGPAAGQQDVGHEVVTPSHVTCPRSKTEQSRSTAVQLVVLLLPWQDTVPEAQCAVAEQRAWGVTGGWEAEAKSTPESGASQEPAAAGGLRIAARTAGGRRVGLGV